MCDTTGDPEKGQLNLPPTMLLRHFLELIDGISVLVKSKCGDAAQCQLRGALDVIFQMQYMLGAEFDNRSAAFLVMDIEKQISTVRKANSRDELGKAFFATMKAEFSESLVRTNVNKIEEFVKSKKKLLRSSQLQPAHLELQRLKKQPNKPRVIHWYNLFGGPRTIEELAALHKKRTIYSILYKELSGYVHGTDVIVERFKVDGHSVELSPLRLTHNCQKVAHWSLVLCSAIFRLYTETWQKESFKEYSTWEKFISQHKKYLEKNKLMK